MRRSAVWVRPMVPPCRFHTTKKNDDNPCPCGTIINHLLLVKLERLCGPSNSYKGGRHEVAAPLRRRVIESRTARGVGVRYALTSYGVIRRGKPAITRASGAP